MKYGQRSTHPLYHVGKCSSRFTFTYNARVYEKEYARIDSSKDDITSSDDG